MPYYRHNSTSSQLPCTTLERVVFGVARVLAGMEADERHIGRRQAAAGGSRSLKLLGERAVLMVSVKNNRTRESRSSRHFSRHGGIRRVAEPRLDEKKTVGAFN